MKSGKTITGVLSLLALGVGTFGACKANDPVDAFDGYLVSWNQARGFIIDRGEAAEVEAHALEVRTPPSRMGDDPTFMLWAVGEGTSLPFGILPEHLPAGEVWPDVVMPETMETG